MPATKKSYTKGKKHSLSKKTRSSKRHHNGKKHVGKLSLKCRQKGGRSGSMRGGSFKGLKDPKVRRKAPPIPTKLPVQVAPLVAPGRPPNKSTKSIRHESLVSSGNSGIIKSQKYKNLFENAGSVVNRNYVSRTGETPHYIPINTGNYGSSEIYGGPLPRGQIGYSSSVEDRNAIRKMTPQEISSGFAKYMVTEGETQSSRRNYFNKIRHALSPESRVSDQNYLNQQKSKITTKREELPGNNINIINNMINFSKKNPNEFNQNSVNFLETGKKYPNFKSPSGEKPSVRRNIYRDLFLETNPVINQGDDYRSGRTKEEIEFLRSQIEYDNLNSGKREYISTSENRKKLRNMTPEQLPKAFEEFLKTYGENKYSREDFLSRIRNAKSKETIPRN